MGHPQKNQASNRDATKERKPEDKARGSVEGEGSYTATRAYNAHLHASPGAARSEELAKKAAEDLAGPEGDELRRAEEQAKRGPAAKPRH